MDWQKAVKRRTTSTAGAVGTGRTRGAGSGQAPGGGGGGAPDLGVLIVAPSVTAGQFEFASFSLSSAICALWVRMALAELEVYIWRERE
jgi:hypothetical protein